MPRPETKSVRVLPKTHDASKRLAEKFKTTSHVLYEVAVEQILKLPPAELVEQVNAKHREHYAARA